MPCERRDLSIPHRQIGTERIRQHQHGTVLALIYLDMNEAAVHVDMWHGSIYSLTAA